MKKLSGTVISDKMQGSAVVLVESAWSHPLYKKTVKRSKKYLVDNLKDAKYGDKVEISESKPLSKKKRFVITKIIS
jgi:small subunit ribosomal protein S17